MKKKTILTALMIGFIISTMITTSAVSFAYWKSGVTGDTKNKSLTISIGSGEVYATTVDFKSVSSDLGSNEKLIPHTRPLGTNDVHKVIFTFEVSWAKNDIIPSQGSDDSFKDTKGELSVRCSRIWNDDLDDLMVNGFGGYSLFVVEYSSVDQKYDIYGNPENDGEKYVEVKVVVSLNEPSNKTQYDKIAGREVYFEFEFEIKSPNDLIGVED